MYNTMRYICQVPYGIFTLTLVEILHYPTGNFPLLLVEFFHTNNNKQEQ